MSRIPAPQIVMPFLISYDPIQCFISHEYIKLNHEPITTNETRVIGLVNHWIENAKMRTGLFGSFLILLHVKIFIKRNLFSFLF